MDNEGPRRSPLPAKKAPDPGGRIDFYQALKAMARGAKVTKAEWKDPAILGWLEGTLKLRLADGSVVNWIVSDGDIFGLDWVIWEEPE